MATIDADLGGKKYVLGRGTVFFDRYPDGVDIDANTIGSGELYLGNTPSFSTSASATNLDHFSSEGGVKVKDDSVQLQLDRTGKFTSDNVSIDNLALYFLGTSDTLTQSASAAITETFTVKQGRFYQLGASPSLPQGHRSVTITTLKTGVAFADTMVLGTDYEYDTITGRFYILEGGGIDDDTPVQVVYAIAAVSMERVISSSDSIYGAIRFIADNPKGENRDYFLPYVKLAPDGDYDLKGDDWQTMSFTMEILKKSTNIESMYVTSRPVAS